MNPTETAKWTVYKFLLAMIRRALQALRHNRLQRSTNHTCFPFLDSYDL